MSVKKETFEGPVDSKSSIREAEPLLTRIQGVFSKKLQTIVSDNYGQFGYDDSHKILDIFGKVRDLMRGRNADIQNILKSHAGLDFSKLIDFTGGIQVPQESIQRYSDTEICDFFSPNNNFTREIVSKGKKYYGRGYNYYFNFSQHPFNSENFQISAWFEEVKKYNALLDSLLQKFHGKNIVDFNPDEKNILLSLLDHKKNTLFLLKNIFSFLSDKNFFYWQVSGSEVTSSSKIHNFLPKHYPDIDFQKEISLIDTELTQLTFYFGDIILNTQNNYTLDFENNNSHEGSIDTLNQYFQEIEQGMLKRVERKKTETDIQYENRMSFSEKYNSKRYKRLMAKIVRPIREQDNFLEQVLSSFLLGSKIPQENQYFHLYGMLYGGIEVPFVMKYVLNRFFGKEYAHIDIHHLLASSYANRTVKNVSSGENYIGFNRAEIEQTASLHIVLDDNAWKGNTINTISNILSQSGPILSGVVQIGLRRRNLNGLLDGNNFSAFLSKIATSASTLPILKAGSWYDSESASYKSMIPYFLRRKGILPKLRGKT